MKFGIGVCKLLYSGISNLELFVLRDLVTHKYPWEYMSLDFNLLSSEVVDVTQLLSFVYWIMFGFFSSMWNKLPLGFTFYVLLGLFIFLHLWEVVAT